MKTLILLMTLTLSFIASSSELDHYFNQIKNDSINNPFLKGEENSLNHPLYQKLKILSLSYGSTIEWHNSVSKRVLELPFHPDRMKIKKSDEFDGWFDEFTKPNLIIIHQEASLVTLIHELRHSLHLGTHKIIESEWFDLSLQKNKKKIFQFQEKIQNTPLTKNEILKLKKLTTRLIETCSEISAHEGDLVLAREFDQSLEEGFKSLIKDYKLEFKNTYNQLIKNSLTQNEDFVLELNIALSKYLKEKKI